MAQCEPFTQVHHMDHVMWHPHDHATCYPTPSVNLGKFEIFKNGKMIIIIIINCQNGSGKPIKFSRSRMMKRILPLNSSREI